MKTAEIYSRLHEIISKQEIPANVRADLEMLTLDIFQDMRRAPGITGKSAAACIRRMLKDTAKNSTREALQYAWTDESGMQCTCDGYRVYRLKQPLDLPNMPDDVKPIDVSKIMCAKDSRKNVLAPTPDRGELKAFIEMQRVEYGKAHVPAWDLGDGLPSVNACYLLDMLTVFPDARLICDTESTLTPIFIASEAGDGLLMPIREARKQARTKARDLLRRIVAADPRHHDISLDDFAIVADGLSA